MRDRIDTGLLLVGRWGEREVVVETVHSSRRLLPNVETAIDRAWADALARPGVALFDGPVCRLESFRVDGPTLRLAVSETSYRVNVGTNFFNPHFATTHGRDVMANPLGVSAGVISADGFLMLGRRNGRVVYYPNMLHPFAGSAEVRADVNLFDDVRRELREELGLASADVASIECVGIAEDAALLHPEMLFIVRSTRPRAAILDAVDADEHAGGQAFACDPASLAALIDRDDVTPIGKAVARRVLDLACGPDADSRANPGTSM